MTELQSTSFVLLWCYYCLRKQYLQVETTIANIKPRLIHQDFFLAFPLPSHYVVTLMELRFSNLSLTVKNT